MAVHLIEQTDHYQLGIWKIEEDEAQLLELTGISESPKLANAIRRQEYLAVRAMARVMGIEPTDIAYLPSGKPYLINHQSTISISHTKNFVAVLLSAHALAGVDVEHRSERIRKIRHKFMHPDEEHQLKQLSDPNSETVGLLLHWCAKESLFKAIPEEGVDFVQELRISHLTSLGWSGMCNGRFMRTNETFQIDYLIQDEFVLTCSFSTESK
ncbi:MAG TPA: 4'-phosphopantetheinyl transferase superfamily protein [Bacteroidales bacterium]|nr:4'-phosphopantetheinyl transferase superfamily protein [Bacteroidales bacterium]